MITTKTRNAVCLTALLAAAGFMTAAQAQPDAAATDAAKAAAPQAAPAAQAVPANVDAAAADAALRKRLQAVVAAMDGKSKLAANNFNEEFLKNSPIDTVQKALDSVRTGVGSCQTVGRMESSTPLATSVLLSCTKGFVPMELAVEPKAPYRISGILLRPAFWK
ncbi:MULTISPECIES: hypothetical protein [Comamonas]|jgi:hypothetical protein|uniref:Uncharacterized protein n=1 Tax=Comamonas testosteroni TaxID=285 RepID=A0A1Y1J674_COMTE|nr:MULTISPECIES: hypothetical protein [Comamonas]ACY32507.1 hypothetical protein CtCNB1_1761 [Comamonas thiooxydans]EFI62823.1 hypothetical protein CTS44_05646 [Comamonas thiooxydans]KKI15304.1 hypothetical protein XA67_05785 [Comamonas thiooxydans]MBL5975810.1 hypothetical protein [Comamonas sp. NyZ500]MDO1472602.1 hypothetical protein [Comamonas thiooxydans]